MPVIIDEIVISVEVTNQEAAAPPAAGGASPADDRQAIVSECVERVIDILERRQER
ncbi:MAG TPA: DUF5908 family protein [Burkholderiales bacterium]|nr:DUF5908 family protein [Burkholderiales bacterium]